MKTIFLITCILFLAFTASAQQKVALQHNGTTTIFSSASPFVDAYNASVNGDTIYLPGGNIPFPATLDKGLTIYGAGHYPDSTQATNKTVLTGNLVLNQNADNFKIEGVEVEGSITFNTDQKIDNVVINRCRFIHLTFSGTGAPNCVNNTITGCVITGNLDLMNTSSTMISNNIITGVFLNGSNIGIYNNLLLYSSYGFVFNNVDNSSITNNIIVQSTYGTSYIHSNCDLCTFSHNIFAVTPSPGNNIFENNNWYDVGINTLFVNQSGNAFDYKHNYHLINPAAYLDVNGTQIGIYGGIFPYKEGAVPVNPHIKSKTISPQTNSAGEINVNISVGANDN